MKSYLNTFLLFTAVACTQANETLPDCSSVSSVASGDDGKLMLGGAIELKDKTNGTLSRCTAIFEFQEISGNTDVSVTTARHCIKSYKHSEVTLFVYDGTGYVAIPASSDYIRKIGFLSHTALEYGLDPLMGGVISAKNSTQVFKNYKHAIGSLPFTKTLTSQLKEEYAAFGTPLCDSTHPSQRRKNSNSLKACFLYTDLVKFNSKASITPKVQLALFRSVKLGANIERPSKSDATIKQWKTLLNEQSEVEIDSYVTSISQAFSVCKNGSATDTKYTYKNGFCDKESAITNELISEKIVDKLDTKYEVLAASNTISYLHEKFERLAIKWHSLRSTIYNKDFVLAGNTLESTSGKMKFGMNHLSKVPSTLPSVHRAYGIVSHFDKSKVSISKGSSGSLLMADGVIVGLLSSINDEDTSGGIAQALPPSVPVEEPVIAEPPIPAVTGVDVPIEPVVATDTAEKVAPGTSVKVSEADISPKYIENSRGCGS